MFVVWHVNCEQIFMARKLNLSKLTRQSNGAAQTANRRPPAPPVSTLYLMQLRAQAMKLPTPPRSVRLDVTEEEDVETPQPVKIVKIG